MVRGIKNYFLPELLELQFSGHITPLTSSVLKEMRMTLKKLLNINVNEIAVYPLQIGSL
jgi:hypothetical protein